MRLLISAVDDSQPDSNVDGLTLAQGIVKRKYQEYFSDDPAFFNTRPLNSSYFSNGGQYGDHQIVNLGTLVTANDWFQLGFSPAAQYNNPDAPNVNDPFPQVGQGVFYEGSPITGLSPTEAASLSRPLLSESISSVIDDGYSQAAGDNNKSLVIRGYFKPAVTGSYSFELTSDDASYLWLGPDAFDNVRSTNNAVVSNPGLHGPSPASGTFHMTANSYYALTILFGNGPEGEGVLTFKYLPPGAAEYTTDLSGKLWYATGTTGHGQVAGGPEAAYIADITAKGATVTAPQQAAISTFMSDEIAAGRWDGIKRFYFPVWGVAEANAVCMKSLTSCTFNGAFTHAAGYIQGGYSKYISLGTTLAALGLSASSHYFAGLFKTAVTDNYKVMLAADLYVSYGEESLRVSAGGQSFVDDNSYYPSDVFGIVSYGSQTTLASRYCKVRKTSGVTSSYVQGGTFTGSLGSTNIKFLGEINSSFWDGQCGALVLGTYMSAADDLAYTLNLQNLYNRILFGYITGLDWQNYADETIAYVIELNKAGVAYV
jgi:hypothetical protein